MSDNAEAATGGVPNQQLMKQLIAEAVAAAMHGSSVSKKKKKKKSKNDSSSSSSSSDSGSDSSSESSSSDSDHVRADKKERKWKNIREGTDAVFASLAAAIDARSAAEAETALRRVVDKINESQGANPNLVLRHILSSYTCVFPVTHDVVKNLILAWTSPPQQRQFERMGSAMAEPCLREALISAFKLAVTWKNGKSQKTFFRKPRPGRIERSNEGAGKRKKK